MNRAKEDQELLAEAGWLSYKGEWQALWLHPLYAPIIPLSTYAAMRTQRERCPPTRPKKGELLDALHAAERIWPHLLETWPERWTTLDVDYEPPRVERIWCQVGAHRVQLHRIHPCDRALFHPHPWPSAVKVLSGRCEMGLGHSADLLDPPEVATCILSAGSEYEMLDPDGWHYVRPLGRPSLSIMVTAAPWPLRHPAEKRPQKKLEPLSEDDKRSLVQAFLHELSR